MNKKNPKKKNTTLGEIIWKSLAFLQVKIDDTLEFGFKKIGKVKKVPIRREDTFAKKIVFYSLRFIAEVGGSFYQEYKNLKKK